MSLFTKRRKIKKQEQQFQREAFKKKSKEIEKHFEAMIQQATKDHEEAMPNQRWMTGFIDGISHRTGFVEVDLAFIVNGELESWLQGEWKDIAPDDAAYESLTAWQD